MPLHRIYAETKLPTMHGEFRVRVYRSEVDEPRPLDRDYEALAIISGYLKPKTAVNLRIHSACFTSEVLGSCKCDCREQLESSLAYVKAHGGLVIYLPQEGRGIGLADKLRVYAMQEHGYDTVEANEVLGLPIDARQYDAAFSILRDLNVTQVNLLTNNPDKIQALLTAGFSVRERIPLHLTTGPSATAYMETKKAKMGHLL